MKKCIILFQSLHNGSDQRARFHLMSALQPQGSRTLPDLLREIRQIDIDPYSDCYMIDIIDLRTHLSQDSDQFLTMNDNIIGHLI